MAKKGRKSKKMSVTGSVPPGYSQIMHSGPVSLKVPKAKKQKGIISQIEKM